MPEPPRLYHGDCRSILPEIADRSIDAIVTDPPYAEIDRPYGRLSESQWHDLMRSIIPEFRRVLKPSGSVVLIVQPNSERVGRMRLWVWDFLVWIGREWNIIQDVYWWNFTAAPTVHCSEVNGLMRPSLKYCIWIGPSDCHRDQDEILMRESDSMKAHVRAARMNREKENELKYSPSGMSYRDARISDTVERRGGTTPFNVFSITNCNSSDPSGSRGHGAGTPIALCDKWVRYLCPVGGTILDPFMGAGTVGVAALDTDRCFVGIEKELDYFESAKSWLAEMARDRSERLF